MYIGSATTHDLKNCQGLFQPVPVDKNGFVLSTTFSMNFNPELDTRKNINHCILDQQIQRHAV